MLPDPVERSTLSVEEVAELLGVGRSAAYEAVRRGEIPSIRVGRLLVVPTARLLAMLGYGQPDVDTAERLRVLADLGQQVEQAAVEADAAIGRLREAVAAARAVAKTQLSGGPIAVGPAATTHDEDRTLAHAQYPRAIG